MKHFDAFTLKWIAIIGMILNHMVFAWRAILPTWLMFPLYAAGGLTFPILAFFVVEGYRHTTNLKKYLLRLFIFGLIAIPFHILVFRMVTLNIMFTIIMGIVMLILYGKIKRRALFWLVFVLLAPVSLLADWYFIGILVVVLYYAITNEKARRIVPAVASGVFWLLFTLLGIAGLATMEATPGMEAQVEFFHRTMGDMNFMLAQSTFIIGCLAAAFLLTRYNGERGKKMKWLFYAFYPLHLAVLAGVALALGLIDLDTIGTFGLLVVR